MTEVKWDLTIRLGEPGRRFLFFVSRKAPGSGSPNEDSSHFSIEIAFDELKARGEDGAEKLMGESVLGCFDHLAKGRLDLPKHYRDD